MRTCGFTTCKPTRLINHYSNFSYDYFTVPMEVETFEKIVQSKVQANISIMLLEIPHN